MVNVSLANQAHWEKMLVGLFYFIVFFYSGFSNRNRFFFFLVSIKSVSSYLNPKVHQILISSFVTDQDQFLL